MCKYVLDVPSSQRNKIEREYATDDERRIVAVKFWKHNNPYTSWRGLIRGLDWLDEHALADQIRHYAEKVTGMLCVCM